MRKPLEMWAGVECTINRVNGRFRDQLLLAGHYDRPSDIDRLIGLGVRTVRYPVLWERHHGNERAWDATDIALQKFREAAVEPIIGLMHHGSGIEGTSLLDQAYPDRLAEFAARVATRYPWVQQYTPVNEPLTTARFSALYGLWYPHHRSDRSFVTALLHEILAVQKSMCAIRTVTPGAKLVATEDLGYTHSVPRLRAQAAFENERRWLTWDLLLGRVRPPHKLWTYLARTRETRKMLHEISDNVDEKSDSILIGINHYLTSERFLDTALHKYPESAHGGNAYCRYADVEAVRVLPEGPRGISALISEAWHRYHVPVVVTEAHLGCTREQQVQWLAEVWQGALNAREQGADVRAVTAWSAFGAFDWNSLLTREAGAYEPGLFDVRDGELRATVLATMVESVARTGAFDHPALQAMPWWRVDSRLQYATTLARRTLNIAKFERPSNGLPSGLLSSYHGRPLLIAGGDTGAGIAVRHAADERGLLYQDVDAGAFSEVSDLQLPYWLLELQPWAVVNATGMPSAALLSECELQGIQSVDVLDDPETGRYRIESWVEHLNARDLQSGELRVRELMHRVIDLLLDGERRAGRRVQGPFSGTRAQYAHE